MITYLMKHIFRSVAKQATPMVREEEFETFFKSPVWLVLRQQAMIRLDGAIDLMVSSDEEQVRLKSAGLVQGLLFLVDSEDQIRHLVTDNETLLEESRMVSERLRKILDLTEDMK